MKITTHILIFVYLALLLNVVNVLCDVTFTDNSKKTTDKDKKKKKKTVSGQTKDKKPVVKRDTTAVQNEKISEEFTEKQISEAREVLATVLNVDEQNKALQKKKKKKIIAIVLTSLLATLAIVAAAGGTGYAFYKKKKALPEPENIPEYHGGPKKELDSSSSVDMSPTYPPHIPAPFPSSPPAIYSGDDGSKPFVSHSVFHPIPQHKPIGDFRTPAPSGLESETGGFGAGGALFGDVMQEDPLKTIQDKYGHLNTLPHFEK